MHDEPRPRDTALPRGPENPRDRAIDRAFDIGILEHDKGRFPAKLERHFGEILGRIHQHMPRCPRPAGKGDPRHQWMRGERPTARLAMAGDDIDHPIRNARLGNELAELQHRRRGMFRRLENHRIPRRQRRADLDRRQEELRIPRHDGRDHPQRLAMGKDEHIRLVDGQRVTMDLVGTARIEMKELGDVIRLPAGLLEHLASVAGLDLAEPLGIRLQELRQTAQTMAALRRCHLRPRPLVAGGVRSAHRPVDILFGGFRDLGPDLAIGGRHGIETRPIAGRDPRPIDQHLKALHSHPFHTPAAPQDVKAHII